MFLIISKYLMKCFNAFLFLYSSGTAYSQIIEAKKPTETYFRLIGEQQILKSASFNNTLIGGISGIDMSPDGTFYLITDDVSTADNSRFYNAVLDYDDKDFRLITINDAIFPKTPKGKIFPRLTEIPDSPEKELANSESIRYHSETNTLFWTSEGHKAINMSETVQPFVRQMSLIGEFIAEILLPEQFRYLNKTTKKGLRNNAAFESLCLIPESDELLIATEAPLVQDGKRPDCNQNGSPVRIVRINHKTNRLLAQYAYIPDKTPIAPVPSVGSCENGVTELLAIDKNRFLVLERSYTVGHPIGKGNSVRVYEIDLSSAEKINTNLSLSKAQYTPVSKKLLIDLSKYGLSKIDNIEGMCWGKNLPNGNRSLVFVSDNNFSSKQITQIIVFDAGNL